MHASERRQTDAVDLPPDKIAFFQRTPQWCMRQAKQMGESAFELVLELLREKTLTHLRQAQGVIRLCDTYWSCPSLLDTFMLGL